MQRTPTSEEKRENGYEDVYVYLYSESETSMAGKEKEAKDYCVRKRMIPHFKEDIGTRDKLKGLMYLDKLDKKIGKLVIYSPEDIGEDVINVLFTIGLRGCEIVSMDEWELPPIVEHLRVRQREIIAQRLWDCRARRESEGKWVGSGIPYGYERGEDGLKLNVYEAFIVRYVFYRKSQGAGGKTICKELSARNFRNRLNNFFTKDAIYKMLQKKDFYRGYVEYQGKLIKGQHTPLLKEDGTVDLDYLERRGIDVEARHAKRMNGYREPRRFAKVDINGNSKRL